MMDIGTIKAERAGTGWTLRGTGKGVNALHRYGMVSRPFPTKKAASTAAKLPRQLLQKWENN